MPGQEDPVTNHPDPFGDFLHGVGASDEMIYSMYTLDPDQFMINRVLNLQLQQGYEVRTECRKEGSPQEHTLS